MRKIMTKDVTISTIHYSVIRQNEGLVTTETGKLEELGHVSEKRAKKLVNERFGDKSIFLSVEHRTETYAMEVRHFVDLAERIK